MRVTETATLAAFTLVMLATMAFGTRVARLVRNSVWLNASSAPAKTKVTSIVLA